MRVLFAATEMEPFASTGGMGDVLGALPPALAAMGIKVTVVLPRYGLIDPQKLKLKPYGNNDRYAPVGGLKKRFSVLRTLHEGVEVLFVDQPTFFDRDRIYGTTDSDYPDNAERFVFFARAVLELAASMKPRPDVIHFHDWHTALGPVFMACDPDTAKKLRSVAAVLTIHNLGYQGIFPRPEMLTAGLGPELFNQNAMEFWGQMNFLKGGIVFSDALIAVSSKYAREIQTEEFGFGLEGIIRDHSEKIFGIINGANYNRWNPGTDPNLPANYDRTNPQGKARCKSALQKEMKLAENPGVPLVGMVTRLVEQKGLDLLVDSIEQIMELDVQFAVLGLGAQRYHTRLLEFTSRWPGKFSAVIGFNERLSHLIEAGSDIFLMPSRYEPCGLNQIYSLRYGTVPVVRTTGGLDDTVIDADVDPARGNGFKFAEFDSLAMLNRLSRALALFSGDQGRWRKIMDNAFAADFSWDVSAHRHLEVYRWARRHKQTHPPATAKAALAMDDSQIPQQKQELRQRMRNLRRSLDPASHKRMSDAVQKRLTALPHWKNASHICTFVGSKPGEVDTLEIIRTALAHGKKICVPVIDPRSLELALSPLVNPDALAPGHFGVLEPSGGPRLAPIDLDWDLALAPGLAFGRDGGRLGFGKGYYDRLLNSRNTPRIALAFGFQVLDTVPVLPHDVPVDLIVTESEIIPAG